MTQHDMKKKTVKAWAIIHPDTSALQYDISLRERPRRDVKKGAWVFDSKRVAEIVCERVPADGFRIVPCTITYSP